MEKYFLKTLIICLVLTAFTACNFKKDSNIESGEADSLMKRTETRVISEGGSIYQVLTEMGVSNKEIAEYTIFMGEYVDFTSIQIGDTVRVVFKEVPVTDTLAQNNPDKKPEKITVLNELIYKPDYITSHKMINYGDSLHYVKEILPFETRKRIITGVVKTNLNAALKDSGIDDPVVRQSIIKPLEATISFETDTRPEDQYVALLEERFYKEKKLPGTKVIYCSYEGKKIKLREAYRFQDTTDDSALNGMYSPEGKALAVGAVRSPLDKIHVTSGFGKRIHPISGKWKFHQGVDYRGKTGTPVYAVANGKVVGAGWSGGYGKEVKIRHDDMITQYAHLNSIFVRKGATVRKGTKIGTVGSTGYSTGPHLHFGLMKKGKWINPKNLKMVGAQELKTNKLVEYNKQKQIISEEVRYIFDQQIPQTSR